MKRPKKIVEWYPISECDSEFVDWNGKPAKDYYIKLPYWLARAYKRGRIPYIQVIFYDKSFSANERKKKSTHKLLNKFFKENYSKKVTKMRKLNHNYMKVELIASQTSDSHESDSANAEEHRRFRE